MAGEETTIFWAGAIIFLLATVLFVFLEGRVKSRKWSFQDETFVFFITVVSYVVMALGLAVGTSADGQSIYWSRWLFYIASCSLLATEVARIAGKGIAEIAEVGLLTGLVMFLGFLASIVIGPEKWIFFGLSTMAYIGMLALLLRWNSPEYLSFRVPVMGFILVFWSLFPVVWVLAPTGFGLISPPVVALLYGALDLITKIGFGFYVLQRIKMAPASGPLKVNTRASSAISR
jgi:sensory rhodopsin